MNESDLVRLQVKRSAISIGMNATRYGDALYELRRLSVLLFGETRIEPSDIDDWYMREGFGVDIDGFWLSLPLLEQFRNGTAPEDSISHSWNPQLRDHPEARFRMYCLRNIGSYLQEIRTRLPETAWIYYQDISNTALEFPYIDQRTAITPDFDWSTYHTHVSVEPKNNPERTIRWASPTIDYAGEGLILSVSIPVYMGDDFVGLWSIDLPMKSLHQDHIADTYIPDQVNFILNHEGHIVAHPVIEATIDREKGSVYQAHMSALGGGFERLDWSSMVDRASGDLIVKDDAGHELVIYYDSVENINWLFFATFPRSHVFDIANQRMREAFECVKRGDLTHRIDSIPEIDQLSLIVEGYNEMAKALQDQEDIRKNSDKALRQSEERHRTLVANIPGTTYRCACDEHWTMEFFSDAVETLTGYPCSDFLQNRVRSYASIIYPEDVEAVEAAVLIGVKQKSPYTIEYRIIHADGEPRWVFEKGQGVFDDDGQLAYLAGVIVDITERKRVEEALQESESQMRTLIETIPDLVWLKDPDGVYLSCNAKFERFFGAKENDIVGHTDHDFVDKELADLFCEMDKAAIASSEPRMNEEEVVFADDGHRELLETIKTPMYDDGGRLIGVLGVARDITERKRVAEELSVSQRDLINAQRIAQVGSWLWNIPEDMLAVSDEMLMILGIGSSGERFRMSEALALIHPEDREKVTKALDRAMEEEENYDAEFRVVWPDSTERIIHGRAQVECDNQGKPLIMRGTGQDITERKLAEEALRTQHLRYYTLLKNLNGMVYHCINDRNWTMKFVSDGCFGLTGYEPEDILDNKKLPFKDVIMPQYRDYLWNVWQEKIADHDAMEVEYEIKTASGEIKWVWEKGCGVFDEDGQLLHLEGFITDISDRKRAEERLIESEARYRTLVEHAPEAIVVLDPDTAELVDINENAERLYGISREEALGLTPADVSPSNQPDGRSSKEAASHYLSKASEGTPQTFDWTNTNASTGEAIFTEMRLVRLPSSERKLVRGSVVDITERKRTEEALRNLRNYLSNVINSMPSVLVGVDIDGRVTEWNREAHRATGLPSEEAVGRPLETTFPRLATEMKRVQTAMRSRQTLSHPKQAYQVAGDTHYEDVTIYPLVTNGVEGAVIRVDDVTERVRLEELMVQSEKMLSVGGLAAGMAHEINNPLAGMTQTAGVMSNRLANLELPANQRAAEEAGTTMEAIRQFMEAREIPHMIATVNESGQRVAAIVDNMLSFARKSEAEMQHHDIADLVDRTLELAATDYDLRKDYDFKMIAITKEYEDHLPSVPCERAKIQQVLLNILRNGAQAMQEGKTEKPQFIARTRFNDERNMVCVEIEDNGPGMDEETRKRVFEPFFTTKPAGVGTGLGLSVSYFIITENHNGEMAVESQPGSGSNFIVRLPIRRNPA